MLIVRRVVLLPALVAATLALGACSQVTTKQPTYQTGSYPDLDAINTANVGEVMVSAYDYMAGSFAVLRAGVPGSFWASRQGVAAGTRLVGAVWKGRDVFCQAGGAGSPCLMDTDGDRQFDRAAAFNMYGALVNEVGIDPVPYTLTDQTINDGFKYELIYQGLESDVVRIAYREYTENLARPAFSQDLTYTLQRGGDTAARFREVHLLIHHADNNSIHYTVTAGFNQ